MLGTLLDNHDPISGAPHPAQEPVVRSKSPSMLKQFIDMVYYNTKTPIGYGVTLLESDDTATREAGLRHITMHLMQGKPSKEDVQELPKKLRKYKEKQASQKTGEAENLTFVKLATNLVNDLETDATETRLLSSLLRKELKETTPNKNNIDMMLSAFGSIDGLYCHTGLEGNYLLYTGMDYTRQMAEGRKPSREGAINAHILLADENDVVREYAFNNLSKYYQNNANMPSYEVETYLFNCVGNCPNDDAVSREKAMQIKSAIAMMTETDSYSLTMPFGCVQNEPDVYAAALLGRHFTDTYVSINGGKAETMMQIMLDKKLNKPLNDWLYNKLDQVETFERKALASSNVTAIPFFVS